MIREGDIGYVIRPIQWAGAYVEVIRVGSSYDTKPLTVKALKNYGETRERWRTVYAINEGETRRLRTDELWVTEPVDG